ncbi:MAG TPA: Bax inhibitor-1 family protein [Gemmataceae bacterium]|nr:Bax inhibitor-1 family protein [Gemmataceae bacterium]
MSYGYDYSLAAQAAGSERAAFIRRTYAHLAGAILAFMGVEVLLFQVLGESGQKQVLDLLMFSRFSWLAVMLGFMGASWLAQTWAQSDSSRAMQYAGLGLYVVAEAVIFLPLLIIAEHYMPKAIPTAAILTLAVFGGLTLSVFVTKKDYSNLRPILCVGSLIALGVIVAGIFLGFTLGVFFSFAMVALMSGYILYYTSQVMLHYRTDQHVAAALALFAAVATLFWYILRIVMATSSRD